jgi:hypothetical protein
VARWLIGRGKGRFVLGSDLCAWGMRIPIRLTTAIPIRNTPETINAVEECGTLGINISIHELMTLFRPVSAPRSPLRRD